MLAPQRCMWNHLYRLAGGELVSTFLLKCKNYWDILGLKPNQNKTKEMEIKCKTIAWRHFQKLCMFFFELNFEKRMKKNFVKYKTTLLCRPHANGVRGGHKRAASVRRSICEVCSLLLPMLRVHRSTLSESPLLTKAQIHLQQFNNINLCTSIQTKSELYIHPSYPHYNR